MVGSGEDITRRGNYKVGRVHEVYPQVRNGKSIVRRVKVAVATLNQSTGKVDISYLLRDLCAVAPIEDAQELNN